MQISSKQPSTLQHKNSLENTLSSAVAKCNKELNWGCECDIEADLFRLKVFRMPDCASLCRLGTFRHGKIARFIQKSLKVDAT